MLSNKGRAAASAALLMFAGAASAETLMFQFKGTVTYTRDAAFAPVGSQIQGTFSYDEDTPPAAINDGYAAYQPESFLSGTVNGHTIVSDQLNLEVFDNMGGNVEDMAVVSGGPIMVDDDLHVSGSLGLSMASGPGSTETLRDTRLPTIYHLEAFDSDANGQQVTYGWLQENGAQGGQILQFEIDSITGGHEPCTNPNGKPKKCKKAKQAK